MRESDQEGARIAAPKTEQVVVAFPWHNLVVEGRFRHMATTTKGQRLGLAFAGWAKPGRERSRVPGATSRNRVRRGLHFSGLALAVAAASVFFAGCIRVDIGIRVDDDGSGTVSFLTAIDTSAAGSLAKSLGGTTSSDSEPEFGDVDESTLPAGSKVEPYKEGKFQGARVTTPFRPGDDIAAIVNQVSSSTGTGQGGAGSGGDSPLFEHFELTKEADGWSFKATINPESGMGAGGEDLMSPEQMKALFKDASFTVRLKLPGSVKSHNADSVGKNGELKWKIDIFANKARTLSARTGPSTGGGFPVLPVVGGVAVVVGLAVIGGFLVIRRRSATPGSIAEVAAAQPDEGVAAPAGDVPPA